MLLLGKKRNIVFGTVLSLGLWTFVSLNTDIFSLNSAAGRLMYFPLYILIIAVWGLISLKINMGEKLYKAVSVAVFALTPVFCMLTSMLLWESADYSAGIFFINVMFYVSLMGIIFAVSRSMRLTSVITLALSFTFNLASVVVNILRGVPLVPSDLIAVGTAAQVAENYSFQLCAPIVSAVVLNVFFIALEVRFSFKLKFKHKNILIPVCSAAVTAAFMLSLSAIDYSDSDMDVYDQHHANKTYGTAYSFYINTRKLILKKPEGYSRENAEKLLDTGAGEQIPKIEELPNIIVIMNESFSDLGTVGDFETNEEYMPFFKSLEENTSKGQLLVSPFGGYTCNTEFEFLTGLSMGLLPSGSVPYMQYVMKPYNYALPAYLSELGYKTSAIHPYYGRCWNRQKVYSLFGFDEFINVDNMREYTAEKDWKYIRNYISDETSYDAVMKRLETKKDEERMFIFNVTMQNHGGYTHQEEGEISLTGREGEYKETEQYLSLIRESDRALEQLINRLKVYDEPTMLVFFGDHQPAVEQEFFEELYGKPLENLSYEELQKRYKVPFAIWTNYYSESKKDIQTSPNYLSNLMLEIGGIPKNNLGRFVKEASTEIPQINAMGHYDAEGVWHDNNDGKPEILKKYENIEYYMISQK